MQFNNLKQNIYGEFEGTFFCKCLNKKMEIIYAKDLSYEFLSKSIKHFDYIYSLLLNDLCMYTTNYCKDTMNKYPDVEYKQGLYNLKTDIDILNYIDIYSLKVQFYSGDIVLNIFAGCDWSEEEALQWIIRNKFIVYVGPWYDFNPWSSKLKDPMFNYCVR